MNKNKVVILFLIKFFAVYFALIIVYSLYLDKTQITEGVFSCAPITKLVTDHSEYVTELFGYDVYTAQNFNELTMMFMVNDRYIVKIVEGCSSVSIIILFLSFIIAFSGKMKATILFGLFGVLAIYTVNILRIALLAIGIYHFPDYEELLHKLIFPAIIYGMIFILWVIWVRKFAILNKKK